VCNVDQFLPNCISIIRAAVVGEKCGEEENTLKVTPDELLMFYKMYGFPLEITTAYELGELERKKAAELAEDVFDEFDPIRAHAMGISVEWIM
jgi:hypothetical protein